jgi:hypothetical protein
MEFLLKDSGECPLDNKTMELDKSSLLLLTPNGEIFRERLTETPAGTAMEDKNTPLMTSPMLLDMLILLMLMPTLQSTLLLDDKTIVETFGLPLLTPNGEPSQERLLERPAGILMEEKSTPLLTSPTLSLTK